MATSDQVPEPQAPAEPIAPPAPLPSNLFAFEQRITEAMDELSDLIPEQGEAESEEVAARRQALEALVEDLIAGEAAKIDATAAVYRRLRASADECKAEAARQALRSKRFEGKLHRLGQYLVDVMTRWGAKRLESPHNTFTRQQNPDTVEVDDAHGLPFEYQRVTFTFQPISTEQFDMLKALLDTAIPGSFEIEAQKKPLLDLVKRVEKRMAASLGVPDPAKPDPKPGAPDQEVVPDGVRLKPGTWRIVLK